MNKFKVYFGRDKNGLVKYDRWCEYDAKFEGGQFKSYEGINIKDGDKILVKWPDDSTSTETLNISEYSFETDQDNGSGKWWKVNNYSRSAYFTYSYNGLINKLFLNSFPENMSFERIV